MKSVIIAAAALVALSVPAFAQAPVNNATVEGTATTSGNSAGMPSAATPQGQIATTGSVPASPPAMSSAGTPGAAASPTTSDSKVTGSTDAQPK